MESLSPTLTALIMRGLTRTECARCRRVCATWGLMLGSPVMWLQVDYRAQHRHTTLEALRTRWAGRQKFAHQVLCLLSAGSG